MADKNPFDEIAQKYQQTPAAAPGTLPLRPPNPFDQIAQKYSGAPATEITSPSSAAPSPRSETLRDILDRYGAMESSSYAPPTPRPFGGAPVPAAEGTAGFDVTTLKRHPTQFFEESLTPRPSNPFDQIAQKYQAPSAAPDVVSQAPTGNPFDQIAQKYQAPFAAPAAPAREEEEQPWYLRPLSTTVLGIPEYRPGAGGIERGVEKFISGLTSPLSVALMVVTGGLGSLSEGAAAAAVERLAPSVAARVITAAKTTSRLAEAGFTVQQIHDVARAVPQVADAIRAGETDRALELGTQALLGAAAAGLSASHLVRRMGVGEHGWIGDKETIGAYQHQAELHSSLAQKFERENKPLIKDKSLDLAARLYHEAGGDTEVLERQRTEITQDKNIKPSIRDKYEQAFTLAQHLPENVRKLSDQLRQDYSVDWNELQELKRVAPDAAERVNYAGQHTYVPGDEGASSLRFVGTRATKTPGFLKERKFDTIADALKAGFEPTNTGLAAARAEYIRQFGVMKGAVEAENTLLQTRAQGGRFMGVDPAKVRLMDKKSVVRLPNDMDTSHIDPAHIITKDGKKYLDVSDYREGPNTFNRYRTAKATTVDGQDVRVFQRKNVLIHPDSLDAINKAFDSESWVKKTPLLNNLLSLSSKAKKSLLSLSPFHYTTEYLRGIQMGLNPVEAFKPPILEPEHLAVQEGTKHGLVLWGDQPKSLFREGVSSEGGWLNKVPVVGSPLSNALSAVEHHLFGDWLPRLKGAAFEKIVGQMEKRHESWTPEQRYRQAASITNAAFGGINWRQLGVSVANQDLLRLIALAPDFTGSQLLFAKAGMEPGGSVVWQSMARIALYNFAVAQTLNFLINGKAHPEHPFSVVSPDEKKIFSVRTMPEDIWHGLTDPRGFTYNRLNPLLVRTGIEALTGKDIHGKDAEWQRQVQDLLRNVTPISLQNFVPGFRREGESGWESTARAVGAAPQQNLTEAERLTYKLAASRQPSGSADPDMMSRHRQILQIEDALLKDKHDGKLGDANTTKLLEGLTAKEVQTVKQTLQYDSTFQARFERLPAADAIRVFQIATDKERAMLTAQMLQKYKRYAQSLKTRLEPGQRPEDDPTFRRLQNLVVKIQSQK